MPATTSITQLEALQQVVDFDYNTYVSLRFEAEQIAVQHLDGAYDDVYLSTARTLDAAILDDDELTEIADAVRAHNDYWSNESSETVATLNYMLRHPVEYRAYQRDRVLASEHRRATKNWKAAGEPRSGKNHKRYQYTREQLNEHRRNHRNAIRDGRALHRERERVLADRRHAERALHGDIRTLLERHTN